MEKKWVIPLAATAPILAIIFAFSLGPSPHKVLQDFKSQRTDESALLDADPTELAPLVITEVANRKMPRRRHAIAYLGRIKSRPALPVLEAILTDESEEGALRAVALEAIGHIDRPRAQHHAMTYRGSPDALGRLARELLADKPDVVGVR